MSSSPDPSDRERSAKHPSIGRITRAALVLIVPAVIVAGLYLRPFLSEPTALPFGNDTPGYIFRARVVYERGLNSLAAFGERPGVPIATSVLRDVTRGSPLDLARASPAVFAAVIALAWVALGLGAVGERAWVAAALGVGVGASAWVALTAVGYASNLLFDAFAVAAVAIWVAISLGAPGASAATLLVAAACATHWLFVPGLVAVFVVDIAVLAILRHSRARKPDVPPAAPKRLLSILAAGVLIGAAAMLLSPQLPSRGLPHFLNEPARKIERRVPPMALPITLPLAAAGAAAMLAVGGTKRARATVPLALWAATAPAGLVAWYVFDVPAPPYRTAAMALSIPALVVLGAGAVWAWGATRGSRVVVVVGILLVVGSVAWLADAGIRAWSRGRSSVTPGQLAQASILEAYADPLPPEATIVIPVDLDLRHRRSLKAVRAVLDPARWGPLMLFPTDLADGPEALVRDVVRRFPPDPVVVFLKAYHRHRPPEGTELGPGVVLLAGPPPAEQLRAASTSTTGWELVRLTAGSLGLLLVTGLGWSYALTRFEPAATIALAPAIGASVIVLGGLVWGRLGLPLGDGGGAGLAAVVAVGGLVAGGLVHRSRTAAHGLGAADPEGASVSAPPS